MAPPDLAAANRQMIAERTTLLRELQEAKMTIAQRSVDTLGEFVDGLDQLASQAARGDLQARALLLKLARLFKAVTALDSGILTPPQS